jgi:hypothetical protein
MAALGGGLNAASRVCVVLPQTNQNKTGKQVVCLLLVLLSSFARPEFTSMPLPYLASDTNLTTTCQLWQLNPIADQH